MNDNMNIGEFKKWLSTLPPEFDTCDISSVVGCFPCPAKRVVAWRDKSDPKHIGVTVNSMGSHFDKEWLESCDIISRFQ